MKSAEASALAVSARYLVSLAAGGAAGAVFWLLRTPTPVPPLIGLVGLVSIALGEMAVVRVRALLKRPGGTGGGGDARSEGHRPNAAAEDERAV